MKNNLHKLMYALIATTVLMASVPVPVLAETVPFDITIPEDPLSRRAEKADSEQKFYVTGTSFNKSGTLKCVSHKKNQPSTVYSRTASISQNSRSSSAKYRKYAEPGALYYMETSSSVSNFHVTGRYTP